MTPRALRFDAFLREYFQHFSFESITTGIFVDYLKKHLPGSEAQVPLDEWLNKPGLPASAPKRSSGVGVLPLRLQTWTTLVIASEP